MRYRYSKLLRAIRFSVQNNSMYDILKKKLFEFLVMSVIQLRDSLLLLIIVITYS